MLIIVRVGLGLTRGGTVNTSTYRSTSDVTDSSSRPVHDASFRSRPGYTRQALGSKGVRTLDAYDLEEGEYHLEHLGHDRAPHKGVIVTQSTISDSY